MGNLQHRTLPSTCQKLLYHFSITFANRQLKYVCVYTVYIPIIELFWTLYLHHVQCQKLGGKKKSTKLTLFFNYSILVLLTVNWNTE